MYTGSMPFNYQTDAQQNVRPNPAAQEYINSINNMNRQRNMSRSNYPPRQGDMRYMNMQNPAAAVPPPVHEPPHAASQSADSERSVDRVNSGGINLPAILNNLKIDDEKVIIIFLLIILARNGSDITLLIALGYLLM